MYVCIEYRDLFLCQVVVHVFFEDLEFGLVRCIQFRVYKISFFGKYVVRDFVENLVSFVENLGFD